MKIVIMKIVIILFFCYLLINVDIFFWEIYLDRILWEE